MFTYSSLCFKEGWRQGGTAGWSSSVFTTPVNPSTDLRHAVLVSSFGTGRAWSAANFAFQVRVRDLRRYSDSVMPYGTSELSSKVLQSVGSFLELCRSFAILAHGILDILHRSGYLIHSLSLLFA